MAPQAHSDPTYGHYSLSTKVSLNMYEMGADRILMTKLPKLIFQLAKMFYI